MVPLMIIGVGIPPRLQGFWNNDDDKILKAMVESCKGVDDKQAPSIEGSPQYYHRRGH